MDMFRRLPGLLFLSVAMHSTAFAQTPDQPTGQLTARVLAVGIPGAGAVAAVGTFHKGGPIHDKPELAAFTQPGQILDPKRILLTSNSNFGAPLAQSDAAEGAVLSLDPDGPIIVVPKQFAADGNQARALNGRVQLFTAQSPAFLNSVHTPGATSAVYPSVSNPIGISINNGFGRLWFSNTPGAAQQIGTESIVDPTGEPLNNAPSKLLGGIFAGTITNRSPQITPGALNSGALASALLGMSPDGSKRAVFAILAADGSLAQAHTEFALDGLAPPATITPIAVPAPAAAATQMLTRAGMIFNWVPERILYITDPQRNAVIALTLTSDEKIFRVRDNRTFTPPELNVPVDLAPVVAEIANPGFASNTTLAGNSDMYVLNRGNGSIVRMRQDGTVVATKRVALETGEAIGVGRLNGIAVSPDARHIWVTVSGAIASHPNQPGVLLELPAFGSERAGIVEPTRQASSGLNAASVDLAQRGATLFGKEFEPQEGLGPLFNARSCLACHQRPTPGGMGLNGLALVSRVGHIDDEASAFGRNDVVPVARDRSIAELGFSCRSTHGPPAGTNLISLRNASPLYGLGLIEAIADEAILANAAAQIAVRGRPNIVKDRQGRESVGRFGWKGDVASLEQFVADAFRNEIGITSPLAPQDTEVLADGCGQINPELDDDGSSIRAVTAYLAALPVPASQPSTSRPAEAQGRQLFSAMGCVSCHTPALPSRLGDVALYSDLLLHDMGPALDDGIVQGEAAGAQWRTTPLWGLRMRARLLHDGRARTPTEAILAHDGDGAASARAFRQLAANDRDDLLGFLSGL
jgi:mono/diheme cytochrome c family protein